jgi:SH3-like domain-containing protein
MKQVSNGMDCRDNREYGCERLSWFRLLLGGVILLASWLLSSGCGVYSAVPVTLQEIKHYVVEQEETYPANLRRVVRASVAGLEGLQFSVDRIELDERRGYIVAHWQKNQVKLTFTAITPTLTKVENRILKDGSWRDFASEKGLFAAVHRALDDSRGRLDAWQRAVRRMVPLHQRPESGATVVAWIRPELEVKVDTEASPSPRWAAIALKMGGLGYLDQEFYPLNTNLPQTAMNEVKEATPATGGDGM